MIATATKTTTEESVLPPLDEKITFLEATAIVPPRWSGQRIHPRTISRWALVGLRGVRLRYVKVGAGRYTTRQWLEEFFAGLARAEDGRRP